MELPTETMKFLLEKLIKRLVQGGFEAKELESVNDLHYAITSAVIVEETKYHEDIATMRDDWREEIKPTHREEFKTDVLALIRDF